ncbi:unnamed protein product, partial [Owenia fusiformis]
RGRCKKLGGYLAIVDSEKENDFFKDILKGDDENADFLLGGGRSKPKTNWVWKDHPNEPSKPFSYTDWRWEEPNSPRTERCIAVNIEGWNDVTCYHGYQFICEAIPL